ncbi:MAG TPA: hypothetical protein PLM41_23390, partial [Saprospiraceae bacterium]|nr:hypothetical protein [Saprospiraceae bacterium]
MSELFSFISADKKNTGANLSRYTGSCRKHFNTLHGALLKYLLKKNKCMCWQISGAAYICTTNF